MREMILPTVDLLRVMPRLLVSLNTGPIRSASGVGGDRAAFHRLAFTYSFWLFN